MIEEGRLVDQSALGQVILPSRFDDPADDPAGVTLGTFDVVLDGFAERTWLLIHGLSRQSREAPGEQVKALCSPTRTCVGVVMAIALAAAIATECRGRFEDREVMLLGQPAPENPATFVQATRA